MNIRFLLALIFVLAVLYLFYRGWSKKTAPQQQRATLIRWGLILLGVTLIALVATGRAHWLFALVGGALPFVQRLLGLWRTVTVFRGFVNRHKPAPSGNVSSVTTATLKMTLDHDAGEIDGEILRSAFAGKRLSQLGLTELLALYRDCLVHDPETVELLETYLDRIHGADWREQAGQSGQTGAGSMSRDEAWRILGLHPGASDDEIIEAHRRLMQRLHPDRGGSDYLAAQINDAKSILLDDRAA